MIDISPAEITVDEFRDRVRRTQEAMRREGYDLFLAWSDCYRMANVRWLSNYRAFDGVIPHPALVLVPPTGEPSLFVCEALISSAVGISWLKDVRGVRQGLEPVLREYAAAGGIKRVGIAGYKYLDLEIWQKIRGALSKETVIESSNLLAELKSIKSAAEVHNMRIAGLLADVGCEAVRQAARIGSTEKELAREAYSAMFSQGADGIAFDVFVQVGENSEKYYLYRPTDRALKDGDVVMLDMGCRFNGYASDNGRGVAFGNVSAEAQRLLDVSLEAFETGIQCIRPGATADEACSSALEILVRHGYIKPGGGFHCGHGTGMDPEEEFPAMHVGSKDVFSENQSLCFAITTLVPGVGGCRVEDPIIVTGSGPERLSKFPYRNNWPVR